MRGVALAGDKERQISHSFTKFAIAPVIIQLRSLTFTSGEGSGVSSKKGSALQADSGHYHTGKVFHHFAANMIFLVMRTFNSRFQLIVVNSSNLIFFPLSLKY